MPNTAQRRFAGSTFRMTVLRRITAELKTNIGYILLLPPVSLLNHGTYTIKASRLFNFPRKATNFQRRNYTIKVICLFSPLGRKFYEQPCLFIQDIRGAVQK